MIHQDDFNLNENPNTSLKNSALTRIQRDLNSPSVNLRLRAMNALKSPSIIYYNNFDITGGEDDIEFNDGKRLHLIQSPVDIKDVMKNVTVYVEVRNGDDNHSDGIKEVISQLGANVNDRLLRNTTHVIFKDGLQSTYNKAKNWEIPIVSILWIEACKENIKLMDCNLYPISNKERYENPELYGKIKRLKCITSRTDKKYSRIKTGTSQINDTPKNSKIRPSVRMPRKPKDTLNDIFCEFQEKLMAIDADEDDDDYMPVKSKLLDYIRNSPVLQRTMSNSKSCKDSELNEGAYQNQFNVDKPSSKTIERNMNKRKTISKIDNIKELDNISQYFTPQSKPSRKTCTGNEISSSVSNKKTNSICKIKKTASNDTTQKKVSNFFPKQQDKLTFFNDKTLDISEKKENMSPHTPKICGKLLYNTPKLMEFKKSQISDFNLTNNHSSTPINTKYMSKNIVELNTIAENDISNSITFNSSKKPNNRRKTIFECSMDLIDKNLHNINQLSKLNKSTVDDNKIEIPSNSTYKIDNCYSESMKSSRSLVNEIGTPKKRKLFIPEQMLICTPTGKEIITDNLRLKSIGSCKRRREDDNSLQSKLKGKQRRTINMCTGIK